MALKRIALLFAVVALTLGASFSATDTTDISFSAADSISVSFSVTDSTGASSGKLVYKINIKEDIMPAAWRHVQRGFKEANELKADIMLIHMNTYGGLVNMADSIRTKLLNSQIPVWVFIDNQAASAGVPFLLSSGYIYKRSGANRV
ncbi:MAG TPA: hypothetical protein DG754_12750 [Bacteroidales bacterium]|nr:hypothetical protein [Bacteroidales bacterium]